MPWPLPGARSVRSQFSTGLPSAASGGSTETSAKQILKKKIPLLVVTHSFKLPFLGWIYLPISLSRGWTANQLCWLTLEFWGSTMILTHEINVGPVRYEMLQPKCSCSHHLHPFAIIAHVDFYTIYTHVTKSANPFLWVSSLTNQPVAYWAKIPLLIGHPARGIPSGDQTWFPGRFPIFSVDSWW